MSGRKARIVFLPEEYAVRFPDEERKFVQTCVGRYLEVESVDDGSGTLTAKDDATGISHFITLPSECVDIDAS